MPYFLYQANDEKNEPTTGRISADNVAEAIVLLHSQGLSVLSISQVDSEETGPEETGSKESTASHGESPQASPAPTIGMATDADARALREQVSAMLERRDTLAPALTALADELPRSRYRRELRGLAGRLRDGVSVEQLCSLAGSTKVWLPLLGGDSFSTASTSMLSNLFDESIREANLRNQWLRAIAYPLVVCLLAIIVLVFLCIFVVPAFSNIFAGFDLILPTLTQGIVGISKLVRFHPLGLAMSFIGTVVAIYFAVRLWYRWGLSERLFGFATAGSSRNVSAMASFTRRLAELLRAGISLPAALRLAGRSSRSAHLRRVAGALAHSAEQDPSAIRKSPAAYRLPANVIHALHAGPSAEPCIGLLQELAEIYANRMRDRLNWSTGVAGQIAILVVGVVVGMVLLGILLPLFSLIDALTG